MVPVPRYVVIVSSILNRGVGGRAEAFAAIVKNSEAHAEKNQMDFQSLMMHLFKKFRTVELQSYDIR